jgi:hypothetical protein
VLLPAGAACTNQLLATLHRIGILAATEICFLLKPRLQCRQKRGYLSHRRLVIHPVTTTTASSLGEPNQDVSLSVRFYVQYMEVAPITVAARSKGPSTLLVLVCLNMLASNVDDMTSHETSNTRRTSHWFVRLRLLSVHQRGSRHAARVMWTMTSLDQSTFCTRAEHGVITSTVDFPTFENCGHPPSAFLR